MRPRKRVLLYCADYDRRNDLAYVLRVRCPWATIETFATTEELEEELKPSFFQSPRFGAVVLVADCIVPEERNISQEIDFDWVLRHPEVAGRTLEVRTKPDWDRGYRFTVAARRVYAGDIVTLQDAMKEVAARKRGPRQHPRWPPVMDAATAAA